MSEKPAPGTLAWADLPSVWMLYFVVESLESSLERATEGGGEVLLGPKSMGPGSGFAVIRDPAGAVCAFYQVAK
jgi:predicted enzyme related to lactoylglutathione lyase